MANVILVEGPDNAGKTSFINRILKDNTWCISQLEFPKRPDSGRFTIETRNEVAIFETMLDYLPNDHAYILDRGYISNIVYGSLRAMDPQQKASIQVYRDDLERLSKNHSVYCIGTTRNKIECDFEDDLISLSNGGFNKVIDMFEAEYQRFGIKSVKLLEHDPFNKVLHETDEYDVLLKDVADYLIKL